MHIICYYSQTEAYRPPSSCTICPNINQVSVP
ncbi:hypothetical protein CLU86_1934 [Acidovorax sp. 62]|nr:hypothetical protein CLU88_1255 [Acidovorax sp. 56]PIF91035.1 hypothetical protein CLU86_1934 [Acidovorax sp. 62]